MRLNLMIERFDEAGLEFETFLVDLGHWLLLTLV